MQIRPTIWWGLDPLAHAVAQGFMESLSLPASHAEFFPIFAPGPTPLPELRRLLATLGEATKIHQRSSELAVILLATAFAPESRSKLDLLQQVSDVLKVALPGAQTMTLVVLVPPPIADEAEKIRTFEFFLGLEDLVGEVPFLNIVFVHQLTMALYNNQTATQVVEDEICELFYRALIDADLAHMVQGIGYQAIRGLNRVSGRKCCYSTVGAYKLVYLADAGLKHLKARFQYELFQQGFMNVDAVSDQERASLQRRADAFIHHQVETLTPQLPIIPAIAGAAWRQPTPASQTAELLQNLDDEVNRALERVRPQMTQMLASLTNCAHTAILACFPDSPKHLAGIQCYIDALQGTPLVSSQAADARPFSGITLFGQLFCLTPFVHALEELFEPLLCAAAGQVDPTLVPRREDETGFAWLTTLINTVLPHIQEIASGTAWPTRLSVALFQCLAQHLSSRTFCEATQARALVRELGTVFAEQSAAISVVIEQNRQERAQTEAALQDLPAQYGWFRRHFTKKRWEFREKKRQLADKLQSLDRALNELHDMFTTLHGFFLALMNSVIVPYVMRTRIHQKLHDEIHQEASRFAQFVTSIARVVEENWHQVAVIPEYATSTAATVLTRPKLDTLYQNTIGQRGLLLIAQDTLDFFPPPGLEPPVQEPSYHDCHNLQEHYLAGSQSLQDRIADYAEVMFAPIRLLNILDIIELHGRHSALQELHESVAKSKQFLTFSPGMVPLVESRHVMNTIFVIRTAEEVGSPLAVNYAHLFQPQSRFLDSGDPKTIHVTCLMFGFPAFFIHVLDECRSLAQAEQGALTEDLWPE